MRHLKYLIFIIISLFSVQVFADLVITVRSVSDSSKLATGSSMDAACKDYYTRYLNPATHGPISNMVASGNGCYLSGTLYASKISETYVCPNSGSPVATYFDANTPIPLRVCKANPNGTYCVYDAANKVNPVVTSLGEKQLIILGSVSSVPSPSCTPEFSKSTCDPKDPYGGCYQPPDDNCNRMADGSIYCPEGTPPPPIKTGCTNNATYCDMPPTGCGPNYVPGNFNGKQICVRNSNPPPMDPINQPPSASEPPPIDPNDPPPASSPPPALPPESNTILRSILDAINAVNTKLTWVKDEIVNSVNNVSRILGTTNQKLDTVNASVKETTAAVKETTAAVNNVKTAVDTNATTIKTAVEANASTVKGAVDANTTSSANKLNEVVNAINNKPVGGGSVTNIDLTETNGHLKGIKEWLSVADNSNPEDGKINVIQNEIDTNFDGNLINATGTCPAPMQISFTIVQTYTVQFSYETFCLGASYARPWIIFVGMLTAFFIVTGHYRGGSND